MKYTGQVEGGDEAFFGYFTILDVGVCEAQIQGVGYYFFVFSFCQSSFKFGIVRECP